MGRIPVPSDPPDEAEDAGHWWERGRRHRDEEEQDREDGVSSHRLCLQSFWTSQRDGWTSFSVYMCVELAGRI